MSALAPEASAEIEALHRAPDFEAAIEGDRRWFRARPWRSYRLRRASPAEARMRALLGEGTRSGDPAALWIVVRQLAPGMRVRLALDLVSAGDLEMPRGDRELALLARLIVTGRPVLITEGRVVDLELAAGAAGGSA